MKDINDLDPGIMPESVYVAFYPQEPRMATPTVSWTRQGEWVKFKPSLIKTTINKCECGLHSVNPKMMSGHSRWCPLGEN